MNRAVARQEWYKLAGQHDPADPVYASWFEPGQPVLPFSARAPLPGETVPGETVCERALFPAVRGDVVVREWLAARSELLRKSATGVPK